MVKLTSALLTTRFYVIGPLEAVYSVGIIRDGAEYSTRPVAIYLKGDATFNLAL